MGKLKSALMDIEDSVLDRARDLAADARHEFEDFMHEQRDLIREGVEIHLEDLLEIEDFNKGQFWYYIGADDEDDYLTWLDDIANQALADEGMG